MLFSFLGDGPSLNLLFMHEALPHRPEHARYDEAIREDRDQVVPYEVNGRPGDREAGCQDLQFLGVRRSRGVDAAVEQSNVVVDEGEGEHLEDVHVLLIVLVLMVLVVQSQPSQVVEDLVGEDDAEGVAYRHVVANPDHRTAYNR